VKPVIDAPRLFWAIVYNVKAIIPGAIAANNTLIKKVSVFSF
tara:strand:- start:77 stop:202 length:126 start_codon:yes stop_codon:yes gene_type:complete